MTRLAHVRYLLFSFLIFDQRTTGCIACSSSCSTCVGSANFCLTCKSPQVASSGQCIATCLDGTYLSSGVCRNCHPDCAHCSGSSFNQCSACPPTRPVPKSGRCLPTCDRSHFFDNTTSKCRACDPSCSSCSSSGPDHCLACSDPTQILFAGSCVLANCSDPSGVVPGLGVCLSGLLNQNNGDPTTNPNSHPSVVWREILLLALGLSGFVVTSLVSFA